MHVALVPTVIAAQKSCDEFECEDCCFPPLILRGNYFDNIKTRKIACLTDVLCEIKDFPPRKSSRGRHADSRRVFLIYRIHVHADPHRIYFPAQSINCEHCTRETALFNIEHGYCTHRLSPQEFYLCGIHVLETQIEKILRAHFWRIPSDAHKKRMSETHQCGSGHTMNIPRNAGLVRVYIRMCVYPDDAETFVGVSGRGTCDGADRDGVVSTKCNNNVSTLHRALNNRARHTCGGSNFFKILCRACRNRALRCATGHHCYIRNVRSKRSYNLLETALKEIMRSLGQSPLVGAKFHGDADDCNAFALGFMLVK